MAKYPRPTDPYHTQHFELSDGSKITLQRYSFGAWWKQDVVSHHHKGKTTPLFTMLNGRVGLRRPHLPRHINYEEALEIIKAFLNLTT